MSELLHVSPAPHIRAKVTTRFIMQMVVIALMPTTIFGIYNFGTRALMIICISVSTCILTELLYQYFMKQPVTIDDFSAIVTGLLLAMNLPVGVPWWIPVVGGVFAILIVKQLFGGLGQNFMNPALAARCFLLLSFTGRMTNYTVPNGSLARGVDAVSGATPLAALRTGEAINVWSMFIGTTQGTIGETSVAAILIGAAFLVGIKVIKIRIPLTYLGSFVLFLIVFSGYGFDRTYIAAQLCGGGLMLGVWFMATDYVTAPITKVGQMVYGVILGVLTGVFRLYGTSAEGVSYAIILSNLLVPMIERFTLPTAFGKGGDLL